MKNESTSTELPFQTGIKKFLNRKGLTQRALADKIYVSPCTVSTWTRGSYDPSVTVSLLILEGMTLEEIFGPDVMEKIIANERESNNELLKYVSEKLQEDQKIIQKETRAARQKAGFLSKLTMLFSAKR